MCDNIQKDFKKNDKRIKKYITMETKFTVDYFIKKFEAIPEELWTIGIQQNEFGQRCALGHCMPTDFLSQGKMLAPFGEDTGEGRALHNLFDNILTIWVTKVNNGTHPLYQQPTPQQRILAALYDIKKLTEPKEDKPIKLSAKPMSYSKESETKFVESVELSQN